MTLRLRLFSVACLILASISCGATIDFDAMNVPKSGTFGLERGNRYKLTKTKEIHSANVVAVGDVRKPKPIVEYTNLRDYPAIIVNNKDKASIAGVRFEIGAWNFAVLSKGAVTMTDLEIVNGGFLKIEGCDGLTSASHIKQVNRCKNYFIYVGPKEVITRNWKKELTAYGEISARDVQLYDVDAIQGSEYMSLTRFQGFDHLSVKFCKFSDTPAQSAPATAATAARFHHGGDAEVSDTMIAGDMFIGPLDGGDGGRNAPGWSPTDPNALERKFFNGKRLRSLRCVKTTVDAGTIRISAGANSIIVENSVWTVKSANLFGLSWPYMDRPRPVASFIGDTFATSYAAGKMTWSTDVYYAPKSEAGAKYFNFTGTTLNRMALSGMPYANVTYP